MRLKNFIFVVGILVFLYPTISDWWNSFHQSLVISQYIEKMTTVKEADYEQQWNSAVMYNERIGEQGFRTNQNEEQQEEYASLLNLSGDGLMGYLVIPAIGCKVPIYHGTKESVLQVGAGHMEETSLPAGGESSHCILSGHRGLHSAKLFTNLDQLKTGDWFKLCIMKEELYYKVEQIRVVLPEETDVLQVEKGKDLCTLVTCTPYGINTHRLLISGRRAEASECEETETSQGHSDKNIEGGMKMRWKEWAKWSVLCFLIVLFWISSTKDTRAQQYFEIKVKYPYEGVEFQLYKMSGSVDAEPTDSKQESDDMIEEEESEILLQTLFTNEQGELIFANLEMGRYKVVGQEHETEDGMCVPVSSFVIISEELGQGVKQVVIEPKHEQKPFPENTEQTEDETEVESPEDKQDQTLPQTGQHWIPIILLIVIGLIFIMAGLLCFFSFVRM